MKRYYYFILFSLTIFFPEIYAQHVDAGDDILLCNQETQVTLNGNISEVLTGRYRVEGIPFNYDNDFTSASDVLDNTGQPMRTDDTYGEVVHLPFPITFYGQTYNDIVIGTNGDIIFDTSIAGGYDAWSLDAADLIPNHVLPYWDDINSISLASVMGAYYDIDVSRTLLSTSAFKYKTIGTAPNRKFMVIYNDIPLFGSSCSGMYASQEIIFNESDQSIEIQIKNRPYCSGWNDGNATLGIQNEELLPDTCGNYPGDITSLTLPNRNTGTWEILEPNGEGYKFVPDANTQVTWYDQNRNVIATGATPTIDAPQPGSSQIYTMEVAYQDCHGNSYVEYDEVKVTSVAPIELDAHFSDEILICANETATLDGTVLNPQVYNTIEYAWTDSAGNVIANTPTVTVDHGDVYTLTVTVNGCDTSHDKTVTQYPYECRIPEGISPNGDNKNDFFNLEYLAQRQGIDILEIYNRWGKLVYDKDDYSNEFVGETNDGVELPAGSYYYVIKMLDGEKFTGWLHIVR